MAYAVAGAYLARARSACPDFTWPDESRNPPRKAWRPEVQTTVGDVARALREALRSSAGPAHRGPKPETVGR